MRRLSVFLLLFAGLVLFPRPAHAYLDPNTLGQLQQVGFMLIYAASAAFLFFFRKIKDFFARLFRRSRPPAGEAPEGTSAPEPSTSADEVGQ